ncbi:hypothetical protein K440DRAFT_658262 [Wilcoxina mikolae CBS 423.85]|nr:hypothetical protein K440DRAFT_658262 [Wilcoxina mikolae CBS 423.85]
MQSHQLIYLPPSDISGQHFHEQTYREFTVDRGGARYIAYETVGKRVGWQRIDPPPPPPPQPQRVLEGRPRPRCNARECGKCNPRRQSLQQELDWNRFVQDPEWGSMVSFRSLREEVTPAQTPARKQEKVKAKKKETPTNTDSLCGILIVVVGWAVYWVVWFLWDLVRENKEDILDVLNIFAVGVLVLGARVFLLPFLPRLIPVDRGNNGLGEPVGRMLDAQLRPVSEERKGSERVK